MGCGEAPQSPSNVMTSSAAQTHGRTDARSYVSRRTGKQPAAQKKEALRVRLGGAGGHHTMERPLERIMCSVRGGTRVVCLHTHPTSQTCATRRSSWRQAFCSTAAAPAMRFRGRPCNCSTSRRCRPPQGRQQTTKGPSVSLGTFERDDVARGYRESARQQKATAGAYRTERSLMGCFGFAPFPE